MCGAISCFDWVIQLCVKIFKVGNFFQILTFGFNFKKVYEETVTSSSQVQAVQGTFTLDAPLGSNVRVVAHCADEADLDTVEVVSPNGRVYDLPLVSDGMLHIRIPQTDEVRESSLPPLRSTLVSIKMIGDIKSPGKKKR